jgi:hypothetical protein
MFCELTSSARALVNVERKALVPEYVASIGEGTAPAKDPMLRINPRFLQGEIRMLSDQVEVKRLPLYHSGENGKSNGKGGIDIDRHNIVHFLLRHMPEVYRNRMRFAHIVH